MQSIKNDQVTLVKGASLELEAEQRDMGIPESRWLLRRESLDAFLLPRRELLGDLRPDSIVSSSGPKLKDLGKSEPEAEAGLSPVSTIVLYLYFVS